METTIPSYKKLYEVTGQNRVASDIRWEAQWLIEDFLDQVVSHVRKGIEPDITMVSYPFDREKYGNIIDKATKILNDLGYKFSIVNIPTSGWEWQVELYSPNN